MNHDNTSHISIDDEFNSSINNSVVKKLRIVASQCLAVFAINLLEFSCGSFMALTTFFVSELEKENAEISITLPQLSFYGGYLYVGPFGSLLGGFVAQYLGSRFIFIVTAISWITSSLIYYYATNALMLLIAQGIVGAIMSAHMAPAYSFITEIAQPYLRNILISTLNMTMFIGTFTTTLLGNFIYWRSLVFLNVVLPALALLMIFFMPESPYRLATKNKFHEAERSLAWYRGWTTSNAIQTEFLKEFKQPQLSKSLKETSENSNRPSYCKRIFAPYLHRTFYKPFVIVICIFVFFAFCGSGALQTYSMLTIRKFKSPINEHTATTILFASRMVGAVVCMCSINILGKRKLMFFSLSGGTIFLSNIAIFHYLTEQSILTSEIYFWIPLISLIITMFTFAAGIDKIAYILNSELFPTHIRQISSGIGLFIGNILASIAGQSFLYIANAITLSGLFLFYGIVSLVGLITVYFILPKTDGKSVTEIEELYNKN